MNESLKISGRVKYEHFDSTGNLISAVEQPNLVVNLGRELIAKLIADNVVVVAPSHIAVGDNDTVPAGTNTALGNELGRVAITSTTATAQSIAYVTTLNPGVGTGILKEAGLFNAASGPDMYCRTLFVYPIPKGVGDIVIITWTLVVG